VSHAAGWRGRHEEGRGVFDMQSIRRWFSGSRLVRAAVIALYIAGAAVFLQSVRQYHHKNTGFTELIDFGDEFYDRSLPAVRAVPHFVSPRSSGYDGQFYAQLAIEPLLRNRQIDVALDTAPYRARRILFSWTAYIFGRGQPAEILKVYALQNIVAWLIVALLLLRWFPPTRVRHVLPWFGCLCGVGMTMSVRGSLLEGPSMVLITLAVIAVEARRTWLAAGLLGLAGLGRETNMMAASSLVTGVPRTRRDLLSLAGKAVVVALPFFLWALYLRWLYPTFRVSNPASFGLPLSGYLTKWYAIIDELRTDGWHTCARFTLTFIIGLTAQVGYLVWRREWASPWWRIGIVYIVLLPFLSYPVWVGCPGAAPRVLLPVSFAFNVLSLKTTSRWFWLLVILGNLSVWGGLSMLGAPYLSDIH
jgi:hypothetical protein